MNIKIRLKELEHRTISDISFNSTDSGELVIDFIGNSRLTLTPEIVNGKPRIKAAVSYIVTDVGHILPIKEEK